MCVSVRSLQRRFPIDDALLLREVVRNRAEICFWVAKYRSGEWATQISDRTL